jgi:la-related protein 4
MFNTGYQQKSSTTQIMAPATSVADPSGTENANYYSPTLSPEELRAQLLKQLEYYFSKENLEKDEYLKSQMNPELYVPIKIIAGFKMVKNLTTDIQLITEVLKSSKEVVVHENNELVRPNVKTQRSTLILRDIDSNTPVSEIEEIFKAEGCAAVKSIKSEFGNTWFITFETETEALTTLNIIRKATFKGQPIQARSKSENLLKNL